MIFLIESFNHLTKMVLLINFLNSNKKLMIYINFLIMEKHLIHNGKIKRDFFQEKKYRCFFQSLVSHMKLKVQVLKESESLK